MNWNGSTRKSMRWRSDPAEDDPLRRAHFALRTVPGIQRITGWTIITEIGVDMSKFPTPEQLASWAGLYPGNSEARQRKSAKTRKGDGYLRRMLTQTAWAIARARMADF